MAFLGGLTVLASLLFYQWIVSSYQIGTGSIKLLEQIAYIILALVLIGVSLVLAGVTRYLRRCPGENGTKKSLLTGIVISLALNDRRSFRAFILASLLYGLFLAFVSGFLVYQPLGRFSETYGVTVPSMLPVICCGPFGQMPQFVVYVTQHFAILIIPVNLVLLSVVSWLVGLNAAIATYAYANRRGLSDTRWLGGIGSIIGLFTACPTCAGFLLLSLFGLSGAVSLSLTLASLQGVFVAVGIPVLVASPFLALRKSSAAQACAHASGKVKAVPASP